MVVTCRRCRCKRPSWLARRTLLPARGCCLGSPTAPLDHVHAPCRCHHHVIHTMSVCEGRWEVGGGVKGERGHKEEGVAPPIGDDYAHRRYMIRGLAD